MRRPSEVLRWPSLRVLAQSYTAVALLGLLTIAFGAPMQEHAQFLINDRAPMGILSLQIAHTAAAAESILASWGDEGRRHAQWSLDWDTGFAWLLRPAEN
jgi:hypothetical protein